LRQTYHWLRKSFWTHPVVLLGDETQVTAWFNLLEIEVILTQDKCTVCAKYTIGSEFFWTHPVVLLGDEAHVEARFRPFGDSGNLDAR
jgi:hypothetical protein